MNSAHSPKRVAVTGASGFLGGHLVRSLTARGDEVSALVRNAAKIEGASKVAELIVGDICDRSALDRTMANCDVAVHLVSNFRTASGPASSYWRTNVEGTRVALEAAQAAGVRRFVHCSTIGVHGHVLDGPADETWPFAPGDLYQETKAAAESLLREYQSRNDTQIVIIRPCSMYGPGDLRMLKMFRMLAKRQFMLIGPGKENFHAVYIDDIVTGFLAAIDRPDIDGETFIVGGDEHMPLKDYIATAAEAVDAPFPWLRLPYAPVLALASLCSALFVPLGLEPPLHPRRVRFFRNNRAFNIDKARRMLGYEPKVDLREGMARTVDWYRENALLE